MNFHVPSAARLGFDGLDHEHEALIEEINAFGRAVDEHKAADYEARFARLRAEMETHFRHEETVMASYGYPGLDWHRQEHVQVLEAFDELVAGCRDRDRVSWDDLVACFDGLLRDMLRADLTFKTYLYEQGVLR